MAADSHAGVGRGNGTIDVLHRAPSRCRGRGVQDGFSGAGVDFGKVVLVLPRETFLSASIDVHLRALACGCARAVAVFVSHHHSRVVGRAVVGPPPNRQGAFCGAAAFLCLHITVDPDGGALHDALLIRVGSLAVFRLHECRGARGSRDHRGAGTFRERKTVSETGAVRNAVADTWRADLAASRDVR